jgi:hypothetical protein
LKNIQLGYTLPVSITSRINISKIRFYITGENLITFTKMTKLFDPEALGGNWGSGKIYPIARLVSAGVNISF